MKVTYTRKGDYLLPDLYLEKDEDYGRIGRYGMLTLLSKINKHFMRRY